jgi:hypothetical protein
MPHARLPSSRCRRGRSNAQAGWHHDTMKVGDRVVFIDDEPELDLPKGTQAP